ncbi:hypothetical protein L596_015311 [Steinernema carpocapsae]|uniref:PABS domain-containing protein n=1 Tax=Steinernema carpocapsae TaxID=34508 RepID=A0A4U5NF69_STECR|nr:hypothetical protein L596_015311 [Steinernema carpocapsae]
MRSLAVFLIFLGLVQSQFIDATVCSNLQKVCFDIVHDSFEEGLFRAVTFQSGDLKGGEAYMSRVSLRAPRNTDLASLTPEERLALPVDGSRPLFSIIEPIVEPLIANLLNEDLLQVLNIGLGAGSVDLYLNSLEKRPNLTTVEIDPAMIEIAREYFGHVDDELHRILLDDGLEVLKRSREGPICSWEDIQFPDHRRVCGNRVLRVHLPSKAAVKCRSREPDLREFGLRRNDLSECFVWIRRNRSLYRRGKRVIVMKINYDFQFLERMNTKFRDQCALDGIPYTANRILVCKKGREDDVGFRQEEL